MNLVFFCLVNEFNVLFLFHFFIDGILPSYRFFRFFGFELICVFFFCFGASLAHFEVNCFATLILNEFFSYHWGELSCISSTLPHVIDSAFVLCGIRSTLHALHAHVSTLGVSVPCSLALGLPQLESSRQQRDGAHDSEGTQAKFPQGILVRVILVLTICRGMEAGSWAG